MKMIGSSRNIASSPGTEALASEIQEVTDGCGHAMKRNERGIGLTLT